MTQNTKRIIVYLAVTFVITYLVEFLVVIPVAYDSTLSGLPPMAAQLVVGSVMFIPAIGVLITRLATKEGFKNALIKPVQFKRTFKYYLMAWFGPAVLTIFGAAVYFLLFPADFDPTLSSAAALFQQAMSMQGGAEVPADAIAGIVWGQLAIGILLAPVLNCLTCFGEEWGWRGYLVPKVNERLSFVPTVLLTGVIWGLWHAPLTAMGHNYGVGYPGWPFVGIFAMCLFCTVLGTIFSYLTIKAKSCLPAVIGHGAVNGFVGAAVFFSATGGNPFVGPMPIGIIGGIGFIAAAIVICIAMRKDEQTARAEMPTESAAA